MHIHSTHAARHAARHRTHVPHRTLSCTDHSTSPATAPATAPLEATNWVEERQAPLYGLREREDEDEEGAFYMYDANDGAGAARSPGRKLPAGSAYINIYSPAYGDTYSQNEAIDVDWTYSSDSGSYVYLYIVSLLHRPH